MGQAARARRDFASWRPPGSDATLQRVEQRPLFSERQGQPRELRAEDLAKLVFAVLERFDRNGYFTWALGQRQQDLFLDRRVGGVLTDPEDFFDRRLRSSDPWPYVADPGSGRRHPPYWSYRNEALLFDTLELIHDAVVAWPIPVVEGQAPAYDQARGKRELRATVNEVLALRTPPAEMLVGGEIVERGPEELHSLVEEPLSPDRQRDDITVAVEEAVEMFRRRGATVTDRQAAVQRLAGALEGLRAEARRRLLSNDESDLFNIANNFAIRHHNARQRTDYDRGLYLEWLFYWYLATVRLLVRIRDERTATDGATSD
jgi:hypothetical protein